jgi:hypothetical protein
VLLIHEKKDNPGRWEVAWMWLPHFLAANRELHRLVDKTMTEEFKGQTVDGHRLPALMEARVKDLIIKQFPITGLRELLDAYVHVDMNIDNPLVGTGDA